MKFEIFESKTNFQGKTIIVDVGMREIMNSGFEEFLLGKFQEGIVQKLMDEFYPKIREQFAKEIPKVIKKMGEDLIMKALAMKIEENKKEGKS